MLPRKRYTIFDVLKKKKPKKIKVKVKIKNKETKETEEIEVNLYNTEKNLDEARQELIDKTIRY